MRLKEHQLDNMVPTQGSSGQHPQQIYATRYGPIDKAELRAQLAQLTNKGSVTARDELLLEYLRELHVFSLDQIQRLFWRNGKTNTARNRLGTLVKYRLLRRARVPDRQMAKWGLPGRMLYAPGVGGWMWLKEEVDPQIMDRAMRKERVLHDLLVSEICVRMLEAAALRGDEWSISWAGTESAKFVRPENVSSSKRSNGKSNDVQSVIEPDSLAIVTHQAQQKSKLLPMFIEMDKGREAHSMPHTDFGRKIVGYNRFQEGDWRMHPQLSDLPEFPAVAVVTHGNRRLLNLANSILAGQKNVAYYLSLWSDLMDTGDILSTPAWLMITPDGRVIGEERDKRQSLL